MILKKKHGENLKGKMDWRLKIKLFYFRQCVIVSF